MSVAEPREVNALHPGYHRPYIVWEHVVHYGGGCVIPNETVIDGCVFSDAPASFRVEHIVQFENDSELDPQDAKVPQLLQKKIDGVLLALNLATFATSVPTLAGIEPFFEILPGGGLGTASYRVADERVALTNLIRPGCTIGTLLSPDLCPTTEINEIAQKIPTLKESEEIRTMIDFYLAAKRHRGVRPGISLQLAFMVLETCAWTELKANEPGKPDDEIWPKRAEFSKVWNALNIDAKMPPGLFTADFILEHCRLEKHPLVGESPVLTAIRIARNKRMVGHGAARDPLPSTRLPGDEAILMAKHVILEYGANPEGNRLL